MTTGYKYRKAPDGHDGTNTRGYIGEHILVAEEKLGRALRDGETVHHIDENKQNNNPDNLMVFATKADHVLHHTTDNEIYEKDGIWHTARRKFIITCPICGKTFDAKNISNQKRRKYCSIHCANMAKDISSGKSIQEIQNLLFEHNGNFSEVARLLGVSSSGIARRLRLNGLPHHSIDYRSAT